MVDKASCEKIEKIDKEKIFIKKNIFCIKFDQQYLFGAPDKGVRYPVKGMYLNNYLTRVEGLIIGV